MPNTAANYLHVVAAVIRGGDGRILLAKRQFGKHQADKWEFPGGKLEAGETRLQALHRELDEEVGIQVLHAHPLLRVRHVYVERAVLLDVWEVTAFAGEAHGREGQEVGWFTPEQLPGLAFPDANYPIVTAALLPAHCLITPEPHDPIEFLQQLDACLQTGIRLIQFRAKSLAADAYLQLAEKTIQMAHAVGAKVMLNSPPMMLESADGLHLTSTQLHPVPLPAGKWLSASCHSAQELQRAAGIGVDFALLSPVLPTASHPGATALGWEQFGQWVEGVNFPVYALGGLPSGAWEAARQHGGHGIAAIRGLWGS